MRRREYYNRRVKQDFAPKTLDQLMVEEDEEDSREAGSPLS